MDELPPPALCLSVALSAADVSALNHYTAQVHAAAVARERERCAKVCESEQDYKEEARAILAAAAALKGSDEDDMLRRLKHEAMVRLMNDALARSAAAIRAGAR